MTAPPAGEPADPARAAALRGEWVWFRSILAVLMVLGIPLAYMTMIATSMITDTCRGGGADRICAPTPRGTLVVALLPWITLALSGLIALFVGSASARRGTSPFLGLPMGLGLGYLIWHAGLWLAAHP